MGNNPVLNCEFGVTKWKISIRLFKNVFSWEISEKFILSFGVNYAGTIGNNTEFNYELSLR